MSTIMPSLPLRANPDEDEMAALEAGSLWNFTGARRAIGMVFQRPNGLARLTLTAIKAPTEEKDDLIEESLSKVGLWNEVGDRPRQPGGSLWGDQQQRLCIARSQSSSVLTGRVESPTSAAVDDRTATFGHYDDARCDNGECAASRTGSGRSALARSELCSWAWEWCQ